MSHFAVLVIGKNPEEQLAPFHQFECTGEDDEYVQDVDVTEQVRQEYQTNKVRKLRDQNGALYDPYEERFYREFTEKEIKEEGPIGFMGTGGNGKGLSWTSKEWSDGKGYRAKARFVPEGFEEVEIPYSEAMPFAAFVSEWNGKETVAFDKKPDLKDKHKYGYVQLNETGEVEKVINRTNPNYKWDWYSLGGRWTGYFKLKSNKIGEVGRPGLMTEAARSGHADSCRIKDIDFAGMMDEAGKEAGEKYDKVRDAFDGEIPTFKHRWTDLIDNAKFAGLDIDDKRALYNGQPAMVQLKKLRNSSDGELHNFLTWINLEDFLVTREEYVNAARGGAISTFAVLKDGQWYQRGDMGWWGCVGNEKDKDAWNNEFAKLIQELPENTLVSVYDCHI